MAIRKQWSALEVLLMLALLIISGCVIAGSVLLTVSGWAWSVIPLSLLPAVFQILALCSAAAAAQKPMPRDRTCANSVWWVVALLIVGSGLAGVFCAASLTLYTACVCPDCAVGKPGIIFDNSDNTCSSQQNTATLLLGCALGVQALWGLLLLAYDISQRTCCQPAFPKYIPPTPSQAAAILAGTTAIPLATHYAVDIQAAELPSMTNSSTETTNTSTRKQLLNKRRPPLARLVKKRNQDDADDQGSVLFRGETESIDSDLIGTAQNNILSTDSFGRTNFRVLAQRGSHVRDGGPSSPYMRQGEQEPVRWDDVMASGEFSGELIMPPRLRAIQHPPEWDDEEESIAPPLHAARSYTPFAYGPPGAGTQGWNNSESKQ